MSDEPDDAGTRAAQKKQALESALLRGRVQIRLDPRRAGVRVPDDYVEEAMLALNLSWRFAHTDMVVNERGLAATLRFGGRPSRCVVPWSALFALVPLDGEPQIWPADVPMEFGGPAREEEEEEDPLPVEFVRPRLTVVSGGPREPEPVSAPESPLLTSIGLADEPEEEAPRTDPDPPPPPGARAPWLKLVQ